MEPIKMFFLVFLILMVMRAPMYLCLLGSSLLYIYLTPQLSMMTAMNKMMNAPNSFTLLAVPFFIFAGQVMNNGGVTDRIFGFAKKMIGHWSGGLAYVNVLSSLIFSGISGSALADVGGLGMIEIKAMRDEKYDDDLTLGVTGASSTVGPYRPVFRSLYMEQWQMCQSEPFLWPAWVLVWSCVSSYVSTYISLQKRGNIPDTQRHQDVKNGRLFWKLCRP